MGKKLIKTDEKKRFKVQFPKILEENFAFSSIIDDFETFIEYARTSNIELSKNDIISIADCKKIYSMLSSKYIVTLSKPIQKSYPDVVNLFILFRISGLGEITLKGNKVLLIVNPEMHEQWKNFSIWEKYFNLLALVHDHFSLEIMGEKSSFYDFTTGSRMIEFYKAQKLLYDKQRDYIYSSFEAKCFWILLSQFGFAEVIFFEPEEGQKNIIKEIIIKDWGKTLIPILKAIAFIPYNSNNSPDFDYTDLFKTVFMNSLPEVKNGFDINENSEIDGIFIFFVKLGSAQRTISISSDALLDDLCCYILNCFGFDYDHMYMVTLKDRLGSKIQYNGCPDMSYANSPRTDEITLGELPLSIGSRMEYLYDFGDNWQFEIILESITPKPHGLQNIEPKLLKSKGQSPEQY